MLRSKSFFLILRQLLELLKKKKTVTVPENNKKCEKSKFIKNTWLCVFLLHNCDGQCFQKKKKKHKGVQESASLKVIWLHQHEWLNCVSK